MVFDNKWVYCKAEIIQQLAARAVTEHPTASDMLAEQVNERTQSRLSARTVRGHIRNLGPADMRNTLPELVETLKKNSSGSWLRLTAPYRRHRRAQPVPRDCWSATASRASWPGRPWTRGPWIRCSATR